jgi:hypothetical protein
MAYHADDNDVQKSAAKVIKNVVWNIPVHIAMAGEAGVVPLLQHAAAMGIEVAANQRCSGWACRFCRLGRNTNNGLTTTEYAHCVRRYRVLFTSTPPRDRSAPPTLPLPQPRPPSPLAPLCVECRAALSCSFTNPNQNRQTSPCVAVTTGCVSSSSIHKSVPYTQEVQWQRKPKRKKGWD